MPSTLKFYDILVFQAPAAPSFDLITVQNFILIILGEHRYI